MAPTPPRLYSAAQLKELTPPRILDGTPFVADGFNVVFGASGAYKSFYVLGMALKLAQAMPVVYLAAEGAGGLSARVEAWCDHYQSPPGNIQFVCEEVNLRDEGAVTTLGKTIAPLKPRMLTIDTMARCMVGGDENSAKDVGMAIHGCTRLQRNLHTSICLIHHSNRADRGERGSGALRGAADLMVEVVSGGDGLIRVSCSKSKDTELWETENYTFHQIDRSGVLLPAADLLTISLQLTPVEKQIVEFLGLSVFETIGAQVQQVVNALNISERHVYRLLSGLKNRGIAQHAKKGLPMNLTDIGLELLHANTDKFSPIAATDAAVEFDDNH